MPAAPRPRFRIHPEPYAIYRLGADDPVPIEHLNGPVWSVTRTQNELSIVTLEGTDLGPIPCEAGWRALSLEGPLDFALTGVLAHLSTVLAEAGISVFVVSTYDTDWVWIRHTAVDAAVAALVDAGYSPLGNQ